MNFVDATYRTYELPWELSREQDARFRKLVKQAFLAVLAFCLVMPWLPVPEADPMAVEDIPPRFAKLLLEKTPPPPPAPVEKPKVQETAPTSKPEQVVQEQVVEPVTPVEKKEKARERAAQAGLLPFAEQLAALRDDAALDNIMNDTNELKASAGAAEKVERNVITSKAGKSSGGITTASMSQDTGGGGLAGRNTTKVVAPVVADAGPRVQRAGSGPSRSREEIELVFEQNKGAIFALYNRALRRNPNLQGKLVLRLTIDPSGVVTDCGIDSSELMDPEMERKLVQRVKMFRFQEKDVAAITTTKPIDFFPA